MISALSGLTKAIGPAGNDVDFVRQIEVATALGKLKSDLNSLNLGVGRAIIGDTESLPYTGNSWGSMTTASVGPAARMAAEDARRQLFEAAAAMLDTTPDTLEARDSRIVVRDTDRSMTFAPSPEGVAGSYRANSRLISSVRSAPAGVRAEGFTKAERGAARGADR